MPDLSGGQKFSFPTLLDFYREVFLSSLEPRSCERIALFLIRVGTLRNHCRHLMVLFSSSQNTLSCYL